MSKEQIKAFCQYWLPPLLLSAAILICAGDLGASHNSRFIIPILQTLFPTLSPAQLNLIHFYVRKTGHFLAYALLLTTWVRPWKRHLGFSLGKSEILSLVIVLLVAILDEGRQSFSSSRDGSPWDVLLDMSGALTAALILVLCSRRELLRDYPNRPEFDLK
jgi:VanZ family protein